MNSADGYTGVPSGALLPRGGSTGAKGVEGGAATGGCSDGRDGALPGNGAGLGVNGDWANTTTLEPNEGIEPAGLMLRMTPATAATASFVTRTIIRSACGTATVFVASKWKQRNTTTWRVD